MSRKNNIYRAAPVLLSDQAGFTENQIPDHIQVLKTGTFFHKGQEVTVTRKDLEDMVVNFQEKVRGIDLMLDFSHNTEGEAAAWFDDVYLSEEGEELWAKVIWTESGKDAITSKKFRYISADFHFNYQDNESLSEHGPTLFGAALTNRPVVKNMQPVIQLSEKLEELGSKDMEELQKQIADLMAAVMGMKEAMEAMKDRKEDDKALMSAMKEEMTEDKEGEKMADKEMGEEKMSESSEELENLKKENALLKKNNEFNKLFSEGKVVEAQREAFIEGDMVKFTENAADVKFSDKGTSKETETFKGDVEDEIDRLVKVKMSEKNGLDYRSGLKIVLSENPELQKKRNAKYE